MRKQLTLVAAAALAAGSYGFLGNSNWLKADDVSKSSQSDVTIKQGAQLPSGIVKTDKDDSEDIRNALSKITESAVEKNGFKSVVGYFVDADRNRIGKVDDKNLDKQENDQLNQKVTQFLNDWKAKYNQDFDIQHKVVFGPQFQGLMIVQGEIQNPALLSDWPVRNESGLKASGELKLGDKQITGEVKAGETAAATSDGRRDETNKPGNRPGDRNLEKGRDVAVVTFPASHGLPELHISMIHEWPDSWRIDVPDNIDRTKLEQNLLQHLSMVLDHKDQWPQDVNDAYRLVSHHMMMAIYDVNASENLDLQQHHGDVSKDLSK